MTYEYFDGWHQHYREPLQPLIIQEARRRDTEGEPYCVVVRGESGDYEAFIDIANEYYAVNFIDEHRRVYLSYGFDDVGDGRVFLDDASQFDYREGDERDEPYEITSYTFRQDGYLAISHVLTGSTKGTIKEGTCDVSGNWETRPKFGEYENLLKDRP
jgi:hypothetical protein